MDGLDRAIELAGGVTALARALGTTQAVVSNWRMRGQVPATRCAAIEMATAHAVTRADLRPDIFGLPSRDTEAA